MRTLTFHVIAGLLAIGMMFGVNSAQAQHGTQSKLVVTSISIADSSFGDSRKNAAVQSDGRFQ